MTAENSPPNRGGTMRYCNVLRSRLGTHHTLCVRPRIQITFSAPTSPILGPHRRGDRPQTQRYKRRPQM